MKTFATLALDLVGLVAVGLVIYGCYLISTPLAFIIGGIILFAWAMAIYVAHVEGKT